MNDSICEINFYLRFYGPVSSGAKEILAIFASDFGIEILAKAEIIYCDGTFATAPAPWCQIFIIQV